MSVQVRDADLKSDRDELIRFFRENLTPASDPTRFDWLYVENPHGEARAWMAVDEAGETVGVAAAFPRTFWIEGKRERGWVLGDFCIASKHRSLGPALLLQRRSLQALTQDDAAICYDFPSSGMLSIYKRLGVPLLGQQMRYVKILRADEKVQQIVRQKHLARGLTHVGNLALRFQQMLHSLPKDIEFSVHEHTFGEEFTDLDRRSAGAHAIGGLRSADYLNWRYQRHPAKQHCAVAARRQGELLGYGVLEIAGHQATISDLRAADAQNVLPALLRSIELILREKDVFSISMPVLQGCHLNAYLRRAGFYPRESTPVVAYASRAAKWFPAIHDAKNWLLLYGDRES